ncbi:MAG TPA: NDP-sugar synthase [Vicinamibacteria bacterium]|nr:NDP-sugar synthase [Vicinamibacteria bacterium]
MKAMVLAAGLGLRMRPLTLLRAKPALPVLNRPLLHWTMERLARAGVTHVLVNLHHLPRTVEEVLGTGKRWGLVLRYSDEPVLLGTGGGPRAARGLFGTEPLLIVNGDVLFDFDLRRLLEAHRASGAVATLALRRNPVPYAYSPVVTDRSGRILSIAGRPKRAPGPVAMFASAHVLDPALLERLPEGASDSVRDLYIPLLAEGAHLHGVRTEGAWYDFGRPALYRDAQLRLLPGRGRDRVLVDGRARLAATARLRRSVVGGKARVARGARVERSVLWDGAVVEAGARAKGSIVATGGVVRAGEAAEEVIVLPAAALDAGGEAGGRVERRGDMAWVELR